MARQPPPAQAPNRAVRPRGAEPPVGGGAGHRDRRCTRRWMNSSFRKRRALDAGRSEQPRSQSCWTGGAFRGRARAASVAAPARRAHTRARCSWPRRNRARSRRPSRAPPPRARCRRRRARGAPRARFAGAVAGAGPLMLALFRECVGCFGLGRSSPLKRLVADILFKQSERQ
jgi:hypothetical protein